VYAACLRSGLASRVLVRVARFPARSFAELEREAAAVDWTPWTHGGGTFRVQAVKSRLFHTAAVAERLRRAAGGCGDTPFTVRLDHDHVTISADAGGEPLSRRGWRLETAKAPLRPTLACAALRSIGWDGSTPLVDPLCGSGTIAIEAAGIAAGLAPGRLRRFAFQSWPSFAPGTWASVLGEARAAASVPSAPIVASDRDAGAAAATAANAARAGVAVEVHHRSLSGLAPPGPPGWLVTNPPWGRRTAAGSGADLRDLYAALGHVVRDRLPGWGVALLVADVHLARLTGLPLEHRWSTLSGGTRVHLLATAAAGGVGGDEAAA
jgi:putative N6-adenine-specific DNA methylase